MWYFYFPNKTISLYKTSLVFNFHDVPYGTTFPYVGTIFDFIGRILVNEPSLLDAVFGVWKHPNSVELFMHTHDRGLKGRNCV